MKKYYVIALVAIAAILVLLIGNIKGKYDGYVQEVSKQIDKSLDIAMEEEMGIRLRNIRLNDLEGPIIGIRLHLTTQDVVDSIMNLPQVKDGTYRVDIVDGRKERAEGISELEITRMNNQDRYIRHQIFIDLPVLDSIFCYWLKADIPHLFTLLDHDTIQLKSYGDVGIKKGNYSKLKRVGLHEKQTLKVQASIPLEDFVRAEVIPLFLSFLLMLLALACVLIQLTVIRRKELELKQREMATGGIIHDLRGPVTTAISIVESLQEGQTDEGMKAIESRNEVMLRHVLHEIETLGDTIREERMQTTIHRKPTDLVALAETVKREVDVVFQSKQHTIIIDNQLPQDKKLMLDADKVERILRNLVENAVKYADAGVEIQVRLAWQNDMPVVSVQDNGWGIAPQYLKKIFKQYYRIDQPASRHRNGHGMGLTNVQHLVKAHGGKIWVQSHPGQGSTFSFTLS